MKPLHYIEATVDYLFTTTNERNIMLSYLLRTKLNKTPVEVGRYLNLSINQINQLNVARMYMMQSQKNKYLMFQFNHNKCEKACTDYIVYKHLRKHEQNNLLTFNRLTERIKTLQS